MTFPLLNVGQSQLYLQWWMPEEMPTPKKSLKELEKEKKQIENNEKKQLEEMK